MDCSTLSVVWGGMTVSEHPTGAAAILEFARARAAIGAGRLAWLDVLVFP